MKVLVACEESQRVCTAFRKLARTRFGTSSYMTVRTTIFRFWRL